MSDGVAGAIIELVVKGSDAASQQADRVKTDLTSAERAGHHAEKASKGAENAAHKAERATEHLENAALGALGKLRAAGRLSSHLLGAGALSELGAGAGVAGHAFHLLEGALSLVPGGGLIAGGLSVAAGLYAASERSERDEDRDERQADRIAKHLHERTQEDLTQEMLRQAGLVRLDRALGGSRQVQ